MINITDEGTMNSDYMTRRLFKKAMLIYCLVTLIILKKFSHGLIFPVLGANIKRGSSFLTFESQT